MAQHMIGTHSCRYYHGDECPKCSSTPTTTGEV